VAERRRAQGTVRDADPAITRRGNGAPGKMRTSRSPPAISRIRATNIRNFASGSRAWSRTTGGTPPSSGEDQLLRDAATLDGIPGILIQGRYDVSSPLDTAWQLSQRWSTSELHVLDDAGHGGGDTFITAVVGALNRLAAT